MSTVDDDTELRDLLIDKLTTNGTLNKIRAQLRASVFLAIEEQRQQGKKPIRPLVNEKAASFFGTAEGKLCGDLIWEFLQYFDMSPTLSVFEPDSGMDKSQVARRTDLAKTIGVDPSENLPLLALLLHNSRREQRSTHPSRDVFGGFEKPKSVVPAGVPPLALGLRDEPPPNKKVTLAKTVEKSIDLIVNDDDDDFFAKSPSMEVASNLVSQLKDSVKSAVRDAKVTENQPKLEQTTSVPSTAKTTASSAASSILGDLPQLGSKKSLPPLTFLGSPSQPASSTAKPVANATGKVNVPVNLFDREISEDEKTPDISVNESDSSDRSDSRSKKGGGDMLDLILSGNKGKLQDKFPPVVTQTAPKPTKEASAKLDDLSRGVSTEDDISEEIPEDIEGETTSQRSVANSF